MTLDPSSTPSASPVAMRPSLRWLLIGSVLLSALALWWPGDVSQAVTRGVDAAATSVSSSQQAWSSVTAAMSQPLLAQQQRIALPERLPAVSLETARFDPFVGVQPPPPPEPKPLAGPVYEPPPPPPPLNYRYLGQMTDPSGQQFVYLTRGDNKDVPVTVGTRLEEGYVVEAITAEGVRLHYPPLGAKAVVAIPQVKD